MVLEQIQIQWVNENSWIMGRMGGSVSWASTLAQVMISRFVGLSPTSGSVLTDQSLEPASDCVFSLFLSLPHSHSLPLSLSLSKYINIKIFYKKFMNHKNTQSTENSLVTIGSAITLSLCFDDSSLIGKNIFFWSIKTNNFVNPNRITDSGNDESMLRQVDKLDFQMAHNTT